MKHRPRGPGREASRRGYSLLEVVAAIALMAAALAPTVQLMRRGHDHSQEADRRQLLSLYAASQVEQTMALTAATWVTGTTTGSFASDGQPNIRFVTIASDDPANGGVVGQLMDIRTTTYYDANASGGLDPGELHCDYRSKLGRFATYQAMVP